MKAKPISWYLGTLTEEQEGQVLTTTMRPGMYSYDGTHGPCLRGVACGAMPEGVNVPMGTLFARAWTPWRPRRILGCESNFPTFCVETAYDRLCEKWGADRVNAMIRNRIIQNRAARHNLTLERLTETAHAS